MKKLAILFAVLFISLNSIAQQSKSDYPFEVQIIGEGKPIILIPGLASSGKVWDKTVATISKKHQCHVLTLAGFVDQAPIEFGASFLPKIQTKIVEYINKELKEKPIIMDIVWVDFYPYPSQVQILIC